MSVKVRNGMTFRVEGYDARLLLYCLLTMTTIPSCSVCKHCHRGDDVSMRDSVAVHWVDSVRYVDKVVTRDSIVLVPLPQESSQSVQPTILPSHLETSLAESDAYVDSLGLHHTLNNKKGDLQAHTQVTDHYHSEEHYQQKDSTNTHNEVQKVEVERELTWWEKFRLDAFCWLILAIVLTNIRTILKWLSIL